MFFHFDMQGWQHPSQHQHGACLAQRGDCHRSRDGISEDLRQQCDVDVHANDTHQDEVNEDEKLREKFVDGFQITDDVITNVGQQIQLIDDVIEVVVFTCVFVLATCWCCGGKL